MVKSNGLYEEKAKNNNCTFYISSYNGDVALCRRLIENSNEILDSIAAVRLAEYSKVFNSFVKKGKHPLLADQEASKKVKGYDILINNILFGNKK